MVKIRGSRKPPATAKDLARVERAYGFKFPPQYRRFLLAHNGGRPTPSGFRLKRRRGPYTDSLVKYFLAVNTGKGRIENDLEVDYEIYKVEEVRMPEHLIPIAEDPFGNLVCVAVAGADVGKVYYWDHEKEPLPPDPRKAQQGKNVSLVADSFDAFLEGLSDEDEDAG